MNEDSGVLETLEHAVIQIAITLGRASGEQQEVNLGECLAHHFLEGMFVIRDNPQPDGFTAQFLHGVGEHRAVAVVHLARGDRTSGRDQFISGGENPDSRFAPHPDLRLAKCCEGSGFPVPQQIATPQHHLPGPNV